MNVDVSLVPLESILPFRDLYRREMNCQIVHDSLHGRGFTDSYLIRLDEQIAGYGCVLGFVEDDKHTIKEFYVLPVYRAAALPLFRRFVSATQARKIETQTNDTLLTLMFFDCAIEIESQIILFHDGFTTRHPLAGATFRKVGDADQGRIFEHKESRWATG